MLEQMLGASTCRRGQSAQSSGPNRAGSLIDRHAVEHWVDPGQDTVIYEQDVAAGAGDVIAQDGPGIQTGGGFHSIRPPRDCAEDDLRRWSRGKWYRSGELRVRIGRVQAGDVI